MRSILSYLGISGILIALTFLLIFIFTQPSLYPAHIEAEFQYFSAQPMAHQVEVYQPTLFIPMS